MEEQLKPDKTWNMGEDVLLCMTTTLCQKSSTRKGKMKVSD
jgi:hypothetical protein